MPGFADDGDTGMSSADRSPTPIVPANGVVRRYSVWRMATGAIRRMHQGSL